jgi:hypothetical protein
MRPACVFANGPEIQIERLRVGLPGGPAGRDLAAAQADRLRRPGP